MNIYGKYILPPLINLAMQTRAVMAERARLVPLASGRVLEVGIGSGINLPFYGRNVESVCGLDPSLELWKMASRRARRAPFPIAFLPGSAESIPVRDMTFDTVVTTWSLCTIPNAASALTEMKRVLKPAGRLIFIEHGRSPDRGVLAWQNRLNPYWNRLGGGCNLNRAIDALILQAGFRIAQMETGYVDGPRPFTFLYRGVARPDQGRPEPTTPTPGG